VEVAVGVLRLVVVAGVKDLDAAGGDVGGGPIREEDEGGGDVLDVDLVGAAVGPPDLRLERPAEDVGDLPLVDDVGRAGKDVTHAGRLAADGALAAEFGDAIIVEHLRGEEAAGAGGVEHGRLLGDDPLAGEAVNAHRTGVNKGADARGLGGGGQLAGGEDVDALHLVLLGELGGEMDNEGTPGDEAGVIDLAEEVGGHPFDLRMRGRGIGGGDAEVPALGQRGFEDVGAEVAGGPGEKDGLAHKIGLSGKPRRDLGGGEAAVAGHRLGEEAHGRGLNEGAQTVNRAAAHGGGQDQPGTTLMNQRAQAFDLGSQRGVPSPRGADAEEHAAGLVDGRLTGGEVGGEDVAFQLIKDVVEGQIPLAGHGLGVETADRGTGDAGGVLAVVGEAPIHVTEIAVEEAAEGEVPVGIHAQLGNAGKTPGGINGAPAVEERGGAGLIAENETGEGRDPGLREVGTAGEAAPGAAGGIEVEGAAGHDGDARVGRKHGAEGREKERVRRVVAVGAVEEFAAGEVDAALGRGGEAEILLVAEQADAGLARGEARHFLEAAVGGAVVDDDPLPVALGLGEHGGDPLREERAMVIHRGDDGGAGHGGLNLCSCRPLHTA